MILIVMISMIEWIGSLLGIAGVFMITRKNIHGFTVCLVSNVALMIVALLHSLFGIALFMGALMLVNAYGLYNWRKR